MSGQPVLIERGGTVYVQAAHLERTVRHYVRAVMAGKLLIVPRKWWGRRLLDHRREMPR